MCSVTWRILATVCALTARRWQTCTVSLCGDRVVGSTRTLSAVTGLYVVGFSTVTKYTLPRQRRHCRQSCFYRDRIVGKVDSQL